MGHLLVPLFGYRTVPKIAVNAVGRNEAGSIFFRHGIIAE
jgi:hypothetical protein